MFFKIKIRLSMDMKINEFYAFFCTNLISVVLISEINPKIREKKKKDVILYQSERLYICFSINIFLS